MKESLEYIKIALLAIIANCGIILVIHSYSKEAQNVYVTGGKTQDVFVEGGSIEADVKGTVEIENSVDVNLIGVMDENVGCHESYQVSGEKYWAIDVYNR